MPKQEAIWADDRILGGLQREAAAVHALDSIPAQWNVLVPVV